MTTHPMVNRSRNLAQARADLARWQGVETAEAEINRRAAQEVIETHGAVTVQQAIAHVLDANSGLSARYLRETLTERPTATLYAMATLERADGSRVTSSSVPRRR